MRNTRKRNSEVSVRVQKAAKLAKISDRQMARVVNGTCKNEAAFMIYMFLLESDNKVLQAAKKLVPF